MTAQSGPVGTDSRAVFISSVVDGIIAFFPIFSVLLASFYHCRKPKFWSLFTTATKKE